MKKKLSAFTLIELLIVVAIIAILAAIAVPNFLEAQTRAKVSKVLTDFRSTGTAIESYAVDNNTYPICFNLVTNRNGDNNQGTGADYIQCYADRLHGLSTPVAYITKIPDDDPFKPGSNFKGHASDTLGGNGSYEYYDIVGIGPNYRADGVQQNCNFMLCAGRPVLDPNGTIVWGLGPKWTLQDVGPDFCETWQLCDWSGPGWINATVFYDPTNGTVSKGDIYRSQAKSSFQ